MKPTSKNTFWHGISRNFHEKAECNFSVRHYLGIELFPFENIIVRKRDYGQVQGAVEDYLKHSWVGYLMDIRREERIQATGSTVTLNTPSLRTVSDSPLR